MIRSFVAIDLPEEVKVRLRVAGEELRQQAPERAVRWVNVSGIHLTLKFLGNVAESDLSAIEEALAKVGGRHRPFTFTVSGVGCFPNIKQPRVIWVGLQEQTGALAALQCDVGKSLESLDFEREKRAFHPHLTLGRTRRDITASNRLRLGDVIARATLGELGQVAVESFALIRSDLHPDGAIYTALETFRLGK